MREAGRVETSDRAEIHSPLSPVEQDRQAAARRELLPTAAKLIAAQEIAGYCRAPATATLRHAPEVNVRTAAPTAQARPRPRGDGGPSAPRRSTFAGTEAATPKGEIARMTVSSCRGDAKWVGVPDDAPSSAEAENDSLPLVEAGLFGGKSEPRRAAQQVLRAALRLVVDAAVKELADEARWR